MNISVPASNLVQTSLSTDCLIPHCLLEAFENASAFIAVLRGPEHVYELANARYLKLMGKRDYIGRPVRAVAPDVADQGFFEILDRVFASGESYVARDIPLVIERNEGRQRDGFRIDLLYSAIANPQGGNYGIFVEGTVLSGPPGVLADEPYRSLLTPRELEVLHWAARGKTAESTGCILGISTRTVQHYMGRIIAKLHANNQAHAVAEAIRHRII